jgi:putative heme iron utilization protein
MGTTDEGRRTPREEQDHDAPASGPPALPPVGFDTAPAPTHAERARTLAASGSQASLSTLAVEPQGHPFGSVVSFILDDDGHPLFVASRMAEHTRNFLADPRASLFVLRPPPKGVDPLSLERVTLLGTVTKTDPGPLREAYLEAHPYARLYVGFRDMGFWRLGVEAVRYVGGFGRMSWVDAGDYLAAEPDPVGPDAAVGIVDHMNDDHAETLVEYCAGNHGLSHVASARMTAVDRYGFEALTEEPGGSRPVRFAFQQRAGSPDDVQVELIRLLRVARGALGKAAGREG